MVGVGDRVRALGQPDRHAVAPTGWNDSALASRCGTFARSSAARLDPEASL